MKADPIAVMSDEDAEQVLSTIAAKQLQPRGGETPTPSPELARALAEHLGVTPDQKRVSEGELAREALRVLADDPQYRQPIADLAAESHEPVRTFMDPMTTVAVTTAVLLVLQSHIEFQRGKDGRWTFKYKKTPSKDGLITPLVRKLLSYLTGGPGKS